jgi:UDP-GlcNAc:undecaprenyl-phosphate GlcNAc-1-phosphate transferase
MQSVTAGATDLLFLVALSATVLICLNGRSFGERLKIMAHPDGVRKQHKSATPQIGGVAILAAIAIWLIGVLVFGDRTQGFAMTALLVGALGVGLIGFTDDQHNTSPLSRILFLIVFLVIIAVLDPTLVTQKLHWASFEQGTLSIWAYCLVTGIAVIGLVNAVNMADGQNGIVGSMFVTWAGCLMLVTSGPELGLARIMLGASLLFLGFNIGGRLFLGDCGTYGVTFVFAMLAVGAHARAQVRIETIVVWFFIPVTDCLRLLISRPLRGRSPFDGDRDHFHHRLEDKLGKPFGLVAYAGAVVSSSLVATLEPKFALLSLAMLSAFYFSFAWLTDTSIVAARQRHGGKAGDNVVSIAGETKTSTSKN